MSTRPVAFARERGIILATLLALAVAAWIVVVQQSNSSSPSDMVTGMGTRLTMGMDIALFLAIWVVMMVAMMFPSAAPMVLTFATVYRNRQQRGQSFVPTWIFVMGYLIVWAVVGALAYGLALGSEQLAAASPWIATNAARIGGALILAAGLYQLSPLKSVCLAKCRTPTQFLLTAWRNGRSGALRMGLEHGVVCVGCCWLLFLILFPLGVMNLVAMAFLTALIFAEKVLPIGHRVAQGAAFVLVAYGALVIVLPRALPGVMM